MVKTVEATALIPGLTPEEVFQRVYGQPEAVQRYHAECNDDPDAVVGEWADGQREVVFSTRLNLPAALARVIGVEKISIREVSVREPDDGETIVISSQPILDFSMGSKFTTSSLIRMSPRGPDCWVKVMITCEAAGPWGMTAMIEETMAAQARATIEGYLAFAQRWCTENGRAADQPLADEATENGLPPPVLRLALPNGAPPSSFGDDDEEFYDAVPATPTSVASGFGSRTSYSTELQSLSRRLQAVEAAVQQLRAQQQQRQPLAASPAASSSWLWKPAGSTLATAALAAGIASVIALQYGRRLGRQQGTASQSGWQSL